MELRIRSVGGLDGEMRESLYRLHAAFFDNCSTEIFAADLNEKDYVITARDDGNLVAFSTIKVHDECVNGRRTIFLFSGDTIVHPDYWMRNILCPTFTAFLGWTLQRHPDVPVYWFLITKGFRTYLLLPTFFKTFHPCPESSTPQEIQALIDHIGRRRYGANYDAARGIISFDGAQDYLNERLRQVPAGHGKSRYITFFLSRNPGYARGDELACLTLVDRSNMKPLTLKMMEFKGFAWEP